MIEMIVVKNDFPCTIDMLMSVKAAVAFKTNVYGFMVATTAAATTATLCAPIVIVVIVRVLVLLIAIFGG